jgi:hypothetical protein
LIGTSSDQLKFNQFLLTGDKVKHLYPYAALSRTLPRAHSRLLKIGLWTRAVSVSACTSMAGAVALVENAAGFPPATALAAIIGGALFGAYSWRRVQTLCAAPVADATTAPADRATTPTGGYHPPLPLRILTMMER